MIKLSCVIVDDEPVARKILEEFIEQVPFLSLAGQFENVAKTEAFLQEQKADILFLDIEMPKMTGLQYLKKASVQPLVILTTAYPEYALEGYELDIIDYLLKPIAFSRFSKAVQKAKEFIDLRDRTVKENNPSFLFIRSDKRIEKIELKQIVYVESAGNYIFIVTPTKKIMAYLTLKGIESQLPPQEFIKIHQSFLVSFSRIESIEGNQVIVNGKPIPISRSYRDSLMKIVEERMLKR